MTVTPVQAVQKAYAFLQNGDKLNARRWASYAASAAPGFEEAWLVLAAASSPRASMDYLERALKINPSSQRARQGMHWARKRLLEEQHAQNAATAKTTIQTETRPKAIPVLWIGAIGATLMLVAVSVSLVFAFILTGTAQADSPQPVAAKLWTESQLPKRDPELSPLLILPTSTTTDTPDTNPTPLEPTPDIPPATATLAIAPPTETPLPTPSQPYQTIYHVQAGDNAYNIAAWYGIDTAALLAANGLQSVEQVQAGQQLIIPPAEYIAPPPSYVTTKHILVDISEQHLYAYESDILVYSFVASTGMGNSTRVGTFSVLDKIPSAYGATWNIWMPNWLGIYWSGYLENGIHALPILPNGATLWDGYLGTPISYGCVVLGSYEAQLLYNWAEVGTIVVIQW